MEQVRVFFRKVGNLKYISHLDLQRAVSRALLRSGLDIAFSEGFNPHAKIAFALPLPVFLESDYEIFDFRLNRETPYDEVLQRLTGAMPRGIEIMSVAAPVAKISSCRTARYRFTFITDKSAAEIEDAMSGSVTVLKKSKTKEEMRDISSLITDKVFGSGDGEVMLEATLAAGSADYLNPNYIPLFLQDMIKDCRIRRLCLFGQDGDPLK